MRKQIGNTGYYFREAGTIFKLNGFSTFLSVLSLFFIFFIAMLAISGWYISDVLMSEMENESDINVYYEENMDSAALSKLKASLESVKGVRSVRAVSAEEAYDMMADMLGREADMLSVFDENPLEAFYEVNIEPLELDHVLTEIDKLPNVAFVRDNRSILEVLGNISTAVSLIGFVVVFAVAVSTPLITLYIIRSGVSAHSHQISTLRLLGAPNRHINIPFLIVGTITTLTAAVPAAALYLVAVKTFSGLIGGNMLFLPAVDVKTFNLLLICAVLLYSILAGITSSLIGVRRKGNLDN